MCIAVCYTESGGGRVFGFAAKNRATPRRYVKKEGAYNIMGKFVIRTTATGFTFRLKARNGEVIATSEVYTTEAACKNGIHSVSTNAPIAALEDQTVEGFETQKHPKFEVYEDKKGECRFRLKAKNGEIVAVSEGYTTKAACLNGVESVRKNAADATVEEEEG